MSMVLEKTRTWHKHSELQYLTIDRLSSTGPVIHACTTRCGGASEGNYATFKYGSGGGRRL